MNSCSHFESDNLVLGSNTTYPSGKHRCEDGTPSVTHRRAAAGVEARVVSTANSPAAPKEGEGWGQALVTRQALGQRAAGAGRGQSAPWC